MHYTGAQASAITWSFTAFMIIVWSLRLYTRLSLVKNSGWEDLFISFAALNSIALSVCIQQQVNNGMGRHVWTLSEDEGTRSLKAFYGSLMVYYLAIVFFKISILMQYLRVFTQKYFRIASYTILGVVIVYGSWTVLSSIFLCWPINSFWNSRLKGHCMNEYAVWFTNAAMNILTDFAITILPMTSLRHLKLPPRQKRLLMLVFGLAGFVCIVSILRLSSLVQISNSTDQTWNNGPAATWSSIEANVGITCACLPPLRPLISRVAPRLLPTRHAGAYGSGNLYGTAVSRRGDPLAGSHIPLSSGKGSSTRNAYLSAGRSGKHSSNDSEEEIIGLKHMAAGVAVGEYPVIPSPTLMGVQPATVVSNSPPERTFFGSPEKVAREMQATNRLQKAMPANASEEWNGSGVGTPMGRSRRNSIDRWRQGSGPDRNEIQVVRTTEQTVEVRHPSGEPEMSAHPQPGWAR